MKEIIRKWYKLLEFPQKYDEEFEKALNEYELIENVEVADYEQTDGKKNLLYLLYFCEDTQKKYEEKGIDKKIMLDTFKDIVIWTDIWSGIEGELCLKEVNWLKQHLVMKLFKIGGLEFQIGKSYYSCSKIGMEKGENVIDIHIAHGSDISPENVKKSFKNAITFFEKYFPEHSFKYFTFGSWMMDDNLKKLLSENSNILKFQKNFVQADITPEENYKALKYIFKWNTTKENLSEFSATSSFAERIKEYVLNGGKLTLNAGAVAKKNI